MLKEELPVGLPWRKLFNSHIGIFGNTGSGKSNTLAKLYTTLFEQMEGKISGKSTFIILDFNGEYTNAQLAKPEKKNVYSLTTANEKGLKYPINEGEIWSIEVLCILFQATQNTQKPFLNRLINGKNKYSTQANSVQAYFRATCKKVFTAALAKAEALDLIRHVSKSLSLNVLSDALDEIQYFNDRVFKRVRDNVYFNSDGIAYTLHLQDVVESVSLNLTPFDEIITRAHLQLINDLLTGFVQFEHIQPLLKRIESSLSDLRKVIEIDQGQQSESLVTVISLRKCNQEMKKVIPLLVAKSIYNKHRATVNTPPNKTMHLIIDEAHNILSNQSSRESESWKDYRLELFEEIVKEGRKFGMYLTLASQRPADISPTIVSQLHNFFIHRLVNDRDLFLMENTISTLDSMSRSLIPNLSRGSCIATGTAFDLPVVLQIYQLKDDKRPDSEDVDLAKLWE